MKRVANLVKSIQIEAPVVNAMFIGYFVLLIASALIIFSHNSDENETPGLSSTNTEIPANVQINN